MSTLSNILKFIDLKGWSNRQFEQRSGLSNGTLSNAIKGKVDLSEDTIRKIAENLSTELNKEGFEIANMKTYGGKGLAIIDTKNTESFIEHRRKQKIKNEPYMVPFMPVKAQAGYTKAIDQETYIDELEKYALPPGVNPQGATWRYWEIQGNSMEPAFRSGDVILTSQMHQMDWENLRNFYLYVIVTDEKVLFKRIFAKNELEWVLISENENEYPQQLLPVEYIKEVWVYRRSIVNKAPPTKMFEIKV